MDLRLIVAHDLNYGIGLNNQLPFQSKTDLQRFKNLTDDSVLIVGRKTLESILESNDGKLLNNRKFLVLSNYTEKQNEILNKLSEPDRQNIMFTNFQIIHSLLQAIRHNWIIWEKTVTDVIDFFDNKKIFVIGGAKIYNLFYSFCKYWYISEFPARLSCDTFFDYSGIKNRLNEIYRVECKDHTFKIYENKGVLR